MLLSENEKTISEYFSAFPKSTSNLQYFEKKYEPWKLFLSEIRDSKKRGYLNA